MNIPFLYHIRASWFKKESVKNPLSFDKGFPSRIYDTGRLIGEQLEHMGNKVFYAEPYVAFNKNYGEVFLDSIYHHGKGSYAGGGFYLRKQMGFRQSFFTNIVIKKDRYELTKFEHIQYKLAFMKNYGYLNYISYLVKIYNKKIEEIIQRTKDNKE